MSPIVIGLLGTLVFLMLLALRMPIAVSMGIVGFVGVSILVSWQAALRVLASEIFSNFSSYSLSVTPMFIMMGFFAFHAGIGTKLYRFAYKAIGHFRGGLAMASVAACAIFGAVSGSSPATAATIGSIAVPEMEKYKYSSSLAAASVAAGGGLGIIIPPSVPFVIYGITTEQSISKLFIAGILPGILLTFLYMAVIWLLGYRNPSLAPVSSGPRPGFSEVIEALRGVLLDVLVIFALVIGGLFAGWFTPTEAGGIGAAGVLAVTTLRGDMNWEKFKRALLDTTRTSAMIMFLIAGAMIFTRFISLSRIPFVIASWASALPLPPFAILFIILIIYLLLGTIIDSIPLILITVPIFYPVVVDTLGYDPIWFGVIISVIVAMAVITPPVGVNVYVLKGVAKEVPLEAIFAKVWPFLLAAILCCIILVVFPQIVTFFPALLGN